MFSARLAFVCLAAVVFQPTVRAQQPLSAAALRGHVETLAADRLLGRETGSSGGLAAAHYIAGVLAAAGCEPAGDDGGWFQQTDARRHELSHPGQLFLVDGENVDHELPYGAEWQIFSGGPFSGTFDLVIASSAAELPAEVRADSVLVLATSLSQAFGWARSGLLEDWPAVVFLGPATAGEPRQAPGALVSRPGAALQIMVRGESAEGFSSGRWRQLRLHLEGADSRPAFNVLGRLAGVGTEQRPDLADEAVVITAHYDHIGGVATAADDDLIYNGADDDASGVAAVLELARMAARQPAPARTLLFLAVTGEEHGLLGTSYYLDHPAVPLEQTVYNLNFEMIGRPDVLAGGPGKLWLTGFELSNVGPAWAGRGLAVTADPRPDQAFFRRSDNYAFVRRGVVAQSLSSYDLHSDYHQPSDEADRLDYEHMAGTLQVALDALQMLSSGDLEPAWVDGADLGLRTSSGN